MNDDSIAMICTDMCICATLRPKRKKKKEEREEEKKKKKNFIHRHVLSPVGVVNLATCGAASLRGGLVKKMSPIFRIGLQIPSYQR